MTKVVATMVMLQLLISHAALAWASADDGTCKDATCATPEPTYDPSDDTDDSALLQLSAANKHVNVVASEPSTSLPPLPSPHLPGKDPDALLMAAKKESQADEVVGKSDENNAEKSLNNFADLLAKVDAIQASVKGLKDAALTQVVTTDPDESSDIDPMEAEGRPELFSTNATTSCPAQPIGWHGCAYGGIYNVPAYCSAPNRLTLNSGDSMNFMSCAFLTANSPACETGYFYTTSTSESTVGVCKCCRTGTEYFGSGKCNYVYYAARSCQLR